MKIERLSLEEKMQLYFSISRIFEGDYCPEYDEERLESYEEDDNAMAKAIASDNHFLRHILKVLEISSMKEVFIRMKVETNIHNIIHQKKLLLLYIQTNIKS